MWLILFNVLLPLLVLATLPLTVLFVLLQLLLEAAAAATEEEEAVEELRLLCIIFLLWLPGVGVLLRVFVLLDELLPKFR